MSCYCTKPQSKCVYISSNYHKRPQSNFYTPLTAITTQNHNQKASIIRTDIMTLNHDSKLSILQTATYCHTTPQFKTVSTSNSYVLPHNTTIQNCQYFKQLRTATQHQNSKMSILQTTTYCHTTPQFKTFNTSNSYVLPHGTTIQNCQYFKQLLPHNNTLQICVYFKQL